MPKTPQESAAERFATAKSTLFWDKFMKWFISINGIGVIAAVLLICFFILAEIVPLLKGAKLHEGNVVDLPASEFLAIACDEWTRRPVLIEKGTGDAIVVNLDEDGSISRLKADFGEAVTITAVSYNQKFQEFAYGSDDGRFAVVKLQYQSTFENNQRQLTVALEPQQFYVLDEEAQRPIVDLAYADSANSDSTAGTKLLGAIQGGEGARRLLAVIFEQKRGLLSTGKVEIAGRIDLTRHLVGEPQSVLVNELAEMLVATDDQGNVYYFRRDDTEVQLLQRFRPFNDLADSSLSQVDFLFGDVSVVATNSKGRNRMFSLYVPDEHTKRLFGHTKDFPALPGAAAVYAKSIRNKAFIVASGGHTSLRYGTSGAVRWEDDMNFEPVMALIPGKYVSLLLVDAKDRLHILELDDPYPEADWRAFFGKVWYEGRSHPDYLWQSTGFSDEFEPKLSLIPVIYGTLKGTFYAMVFAVPIALLAALYTSQFQKQKFRKVVKPTMEVMASLPSVVLGFLGALWLAPLLETRIPTVLLFLVMLPVVAIVIGWFWYKLPKNTRHLIPQGYEFIPFMLIIIPICWAIAANTGPALESWLFVVEDPASKVKIADFRMWWTHVTGMDFEQRNAVVVGFMMGFAVIPIIFTIAEDALSNVPKTLISASDALGASRWQTAVRVVLPTASAGVFSAIMMGLGRAVGETMIVLMATGNTPVKDMNPFNGMRTLAANIAVELPEAPQGETLYRTLFLGALILFLLTFVINTMAELLRQHFRNKYRI